MRAESGIREHSNVLRWMLLLLFLAAVGAGLAVLVFSAGGESAGATKKGSQAERVAAARELRTSLVNRSDTKGARKGSAERAFLDYWLSLQFQDWPRAVGAYDPALRDFIGAARLSEALKAQAPYYRTVKPRLNSSVGRGDGRTVRFFLKDPSGKVLPQTVSWRRAGNVWRIRFDSLLDGILQSYVQTRVQDRINPAARNASSRAVRAGQSAAELQANFLQRSAPPGGNR